MPHYLSFKLPFKCTESCVRTLCLEGDRKTSVRNVSVAQFFKRSGHLRSSIWCFVNLRLSRLIPSVLQRFRAWKGQERNPRRGCKAGSRILWSGVRLALLRFGGTQRAKALLQVALIAPAATKLSLGDAIVHFVALQLFEGHAPESSPLGQEHTF
jgi:hypothetical protein